jgi:hypothetical protein
MRNEQIIRLDRARREKIFLLQKNIEDHRCVFNICGTSKNVYNVSAYFGSGKIFCNCPDGRGKSKNIGVFCKHICFMIEKVFSRLFNVEASNIYDILIFNSEERNKIKEFVQSDLQFDSTFMDQDVIQKFINARKNMESDEKKITLDMIKDIECPICYDEFENTNVLRCEVCLKLFHNDCINIWLQTSHNKSCPHCRSPMKNTTGYYINLD